MKQLTRDAAREWLSSKNSTWAKNRLLADMKRKKVSYDIGDTACKFSGASRSLSIYCSWEAVRELPFYDETFSREFKIELKIDESGDLEQW